MVLGQVDLGFGGNSSPTDLSAGNIKSKKGNGLDFRSEHNSVPNKGFLSSVKSKKDLARIKPQSSHVASSDGDSSGLQFFVPKSIVNFSSLPNEPSNLDGLFHFSSTSPTLVGNHGKRVECGNSGSGLRGSLSKAHSWDGVIQSLARDGMEAEFLLNGGECNAGLPSPVQPKLGGNATPLEAFHNGQSKSSEMDAINVDFGSREGPITGNDGKSGMDFDGGGEATACLQ